MINSSTLKELPTWGGKSKFRYNGCVADGTQIHYGENSKITVKREDYAALFKTFAGKEVPIGTSRTTALYDSVGAWLIAHVSKTALASYIGPILVNEGYAKRGSVADLIWFNP
jgi:hypothetical protein